MKQKASSNLLRNLVLIVFAGFALWWLYINGILRDPTHGNIHYQWFGATYGVLALIGGIIGLIASKRWGLHKSLVGRALLFFSIGLLAQTFGQIAYSYYVYVSKIDVPYPSVGDVGYFGSVLFYIYAAWQLARAAGIKFSLKDRNKKVIATVLPLALLAGCYFYFLRGYEFDWSHPLTVFLDFGYPLGQTVYLVIGLMTYLFSKDLLGGIMKNKVLLLLAALFMQYVADFTFLNAAKNGTFFASGANDFMYLIAYAVMALALNTFRLSLAANKTQEETAKEPEGTS